MYLIISWTNIAELYPTAGIPKTGVSKILTTAGVSNKWPRTIFLRYTGYYIDDQYFPYILICLIYLPLVLVHTFAVSVLIFHLPTKYIQTINFKTTKGYSNSSSMKRRKLNHLHRHLYLMRAY